jgi:hypothetical protein
MARRPSWLIVSLAVCAASCGDNQVQPSDVTARSGDGVPSSLVALTDQPWSALTANGWRYLRRESARDADIVTDATAPMSPPHVLRITFTPAMPPDTEPTVHWVGLPNSTEVSAAWWIKLSPNWKGSETCCGKMTFLFPQEASQGVIYSNISGTDTARYVNIATTWPSTGYRFWEPNAATTRIKDGEWHRIEWYLKWESRRGANDGVIRWKVNGVVNGDYRNVPFPSIRGFSEFQHAPTQHRLPAGEQYMYIDHTTITQATER